MSEPIGNYEWRHVSEVEENDLVWCDTIGRWRKVTSVWHYTTEVSKTDMVKIVTDLSAYHRYVKDEGNRLAVLLDAEPHPKVRPLTPTERRRALRGRGGQDEDEAPAGSPGAAATAPAQQAAGQPVSGQPVEAVSPPAETTASNARQVDQGGDVRGRREALRLSRNALAALAGLTPGALWRVEDGRPKDDELQRVIAALATEEGKS